MPWEGDERGGRGGGSGRVDGRCEGEKKRNREGKSERLPSKPKRYGIFLRCEKIGPPEGVQA